MSGKVTGFIVSYSKNELKGWLKDGRVMLGHTCGGGFYLRANDIGFHTDHVSCGSYSCDSIQFGRVKFDDGPPSDIEFGVWENNNDGMYIRYSISKLISAMKKGKTMRLELELFMTKGNQQIAEFDLNGFTKVFNQCSKNTSAESNVKKERRKPMVLISTSHGDIKLELYEKEAPITVANFLSYVEEGFYDNTIFHRVINNFMVQGGGITADMKQKPTKAPIKNEAENGLKNERGTVAMARTADVNSATSQFFINHRDNAFLDHGVRDFGYAVFGKVVEGMEVVDKIAAVKTRPGDVPLETVSILSIKSVN